MFASKFKLLKISTIMLHSRSITITAAMVKELRERSNAPMMDCKKALTEVDGDMNKAVDWLRAKGIAKANQANRTATEGLIGIYCSQGKASLVEINSETDFVGRNVAFQSFVALVATSVHTRISEPGPVSIEELLKLPPAPVTVPGSGLASQGGSASLKEALGDITSAIRENIVIRRALNVTVGNTDSEGLLAAYMHGQVEAGEHIPENVMLGKFAAVVTLKVTPPLPATAEAVAARKALQSTGRKIAMHVIAARPEYLQPTDVPPEVLQRETAIIREQTEAASAAEREKGGKPKTEDMLNKIVAAKLSKRLGELCLLTQAHVAEEGSPLVGKFVDSLGGGLSKALGADAGLRVVVSVPAFERWTLGQHQH